CTDDDVLELASDNTWTSIGSEAFACPSGDFWSTLQFGDLALFTNTEDGLQKYDIETPAGFSEVTGAGKPRFVCTTGNMLFAGDCEDDSGDRDNRLLRNSNFIDVDDWDTGAADQQVLAVGGALRAGFDLGNGQAVVVQDRAVHGIQVGGRTWSMALLSDG